ncbi:coiled-coil domain-containing protein 136 isoform X2 [Cinnamomum micranthum f. kanehirae]|uniref:Coiled-coil domain-containing protein 136 isoform X2 n=1 Tax=Cinnamomum micranthum f. kanehirae TaxID=337451 RepID=A0A443NUM4_9MAGN|nr:coiled-coil domain-containing protein 136 isoform X2 [Cinnamomum micranthum f. kanehirae]
MAGTDSQKQFLTLIRDFATEKSQSERRVSDLRKHYSELQTAFDAANADLENTKRSKETIEHELRCFQVESSLKDPSIQAQEARISLLQQEMSKLESNLGDLKNDESVLRDDFITKMLEFNKKLRKLQEMSVDYFRKDGHTELSSTVGEEKLRGKQASFDIQDNLRALEDKLAHAGDQIRLEEQEYQEEENIHKETAESEKEYALLGQLMQRRYACPNCQLDNMADMGGTVST